MVLSHIKLPKMLCHLGVLGCHLQPRILTEKGQAGSCKQLHLLCLPDQWNLPGTALLLSGSLQWCHNEHDSVSNHQPHIWLLNRLFGRRSKKTSKLRVTGLYVGNSPGTGEFPAQMASNAENVSIWWRHHDFKTPRDVLLFHLVLVWAHCWIDTWFASNLRRHNTHVKSL